jgi:formylglycine-generating enzyme required for sulfatase activity
MERTHVTHATIRRAQPRARRGSLPRRFALVIAALLVPLFVHASGRPAADTPLVRIPAGRYEPLYASARPFVPVPVGAFMLMTRPVTNAEFLAFVTDRPEYRRDRIARVFADESYLAHWRAALELGPSALPAQPVTRVSWFAAKAFCEHQGLRLPTEAEWELAAAADEKRADARNDPAFRERLLSWYATPNRELAAVPHGPANLYGVHDLHGVVWEWVLDFNNAAPAADSREGDSARDRFCGGGALLARDTTDYAAFMRFAMRGSLEAQYTTANLGFRCAADASAVAGGRR